jgi:hypothetical protein
MEGQPKSSKPEKSGNDRIRIVIPARKPGEKEQEKNQ